MSDDDLKNLTSFADFLKSLNPSELLILSEMLEKAKGSHITQQSDSNKKYYNTKLKEFQRQFNTFP